MTESRAIDLESRRLIREELLTNVLVEAGAGSGKTQMLAERMAAGVASGVYQVEHMAAVTFTRKAASELRGRFHLALEKQLAESLGGRDFSSADQGLPEHVQHALSHLERFFAGTIHSFCARLLRERPVESGVSPGFTELDEVQDNELRQRAWRDFIANARSVGDPDVMALLETGVRPTDLDSAFATVCLNDDVEFPPGEDACPDPKAAWHALDAFWKELQKLLPTPTDPETTCNIQKAAGTFRGQLRVSKYRLDRPSVMASLLETWDRELKVVQKWWPGTSAETKRLRDQLGALHTGFRHETATPYVAQWRQYVYRLSVTLLARAREMAASERRRLNSLNYGDLLNLTAKVLRENAHVRYALQQKYRFLFVDEFQDTDPVQAEIVFLLAAADERPEATRVETAPRPPYPDWRALPLRPGALFVVGDPKQSIYRFRRADIEIYNIVRARFSDAAIGRVLPLTRNFRSVSSLCEWANDVFKTRFPAEPTAQSPRFAALDAREGGPTTGGVFTLTHACERGDVIAQDAERIARHVRSEVDAGRRRYSDFLILTRKKRDHIVPYAEQLEALNIPVEVSGAGAFGQSAEVAALTVLLRALADPQDALSLIAVLRGPLFGISDPELFAFKQAGGWFSIFHGVDAKDDRGHSGGPAFSGPNAVCPAGGAARVASALTELRQYYRWTRFLPAAAALERVFDRSGYFALAATTIGGVEAGDLLHAVDRVRQVVEGGGSLANAADALADDSEAGSEVESLPLEPGRTDVVRIMNLHKAKGLEADVVFLADPCGGFEPHVDLHIERIDLKAQGWFKVVKKVEGQSWGGKLLGEHRDWPAHEAAELPYLQAEQNRLLYVAATRAREVLVVSRFMGHHKTKAWSELDPFLADSSELAGAAIAAVPLTAPLDCSTDVQVEGIALRAAAHERLLQPSWSITSVTAEARHIARITRSADASADDPTKVVGTDTPTHRADAGQAWGTLIHGLLEHAMRHTSATRDDLRRLAVWLTVEEPKLRTVIDEALDTVERAARADFWQRARTGEHSVETPFVVSGNVNSLTNGVIDLLFHSKEGWQVVDYKTDLLIDSQAHASQLLSYRAALQKVGRDVGNAAVVNVRSAP